MNDLFKGLTFFEVASGKNNLSKTLVYAGTEYQRRSTVDVMPWIDFGKTTKFDVSITNK